MNLKSYLFDERIAIAEFGQKIGVGSPTVWRWAEGKCFPAPHHLRAIAEATDGRVTPNDFLDVFKSLP